MRARRGPVLVLLAVLAVLLQSTVLARLPLPGAAPDLLVAVVVAVGLLAGPRPAMAAGFGAGLLADLAGDAELGRTALVLVVVGYLAGRLQGDADGSPLLPVLVTGALTVLAVLLHAGEGVLLSDPRVSGGALSRSLVSTVPYSALLSLVVFPPVGALLRRVDRRP